MTPVGRSAGRLARLFLLVFSAGAASVLAYQPFGFFPLLFVSLAVLFWCLRRAESGKGGFALGFGWGFGVFAFGVSWLYVALNRYGGVPAPVAAISIGLFCAYLALFPALASALFVRLRRLVPSGRAADQASVVRPSFEVALFAALWMLQEMARGFLFTGFPWLAVGYSQTAPSPLAGFLPVLGVYGVGGLVALLSALLVFALIGVTRSRLAVALPIVLVLASGAGLARFQWTEPVGEPIKVVLVQTAIEQDLKWDPARLREWLDINARMASGHQADLVVLPETTLPVLDEQLPQGYLAYLEAEAVRRGGNIVFGVFTRDEAGWIHNAALNLGVDGRQHYAKHHLVPFGEFSPPLFGWFYRVADIPMSDQSPGAADQPPMRLGNQRVAINICYEDLFGREIIRSLPEATLMLNLSNLAWYGRSLAQPQHLQIAIVRALETGRPMLRSTNTGMTALIMPNGQVSAVLPEFERASLDVEVQGYRGMTPYALTGDWMALGLSLFLLLPALIVRGQARVAESQ